MAFTPEEFAASNTAQQLQYVRESIGRVLYAQANGTGVNHIERANLDALYRAEALLVSRLAKESGGGGFWLTDYSRGPGGGVLGSS